MASTPWQALQAMLASDPAAPRITFYERTAGPTQGERIELSGKVLVNWVSKAANLLTEDFDVEPGSRVGVTLPAAHWRTTYWCLAAWSAGATVVFVDTDANPESAVADVVGDVDVLVTNVAFDDAAEQIVVSLAMLARQGDDVPSGALDEARELSTFGDVFDPFVEPSAEDVALEPGDVSFSRLLAGATRPASDGAAARVYLRDPSPQRLMEVLACGGSVVLVRGALGEAELERILEQESASPA